MAELQRTGITGSLVLSGSVDGPSGFPSGHGAFYVSGGFPYFSSSAIDVNSSGTVKMTISFVSFSPSTTLLLIQLKIPKDNKSAVDNINIFFILVQRFIKFESLLDFSCRLSIV